MKNDSPENAVPSELVEYLRRELNFLWYACRIFDEGYEEIAVKMAVSIRVLAHDTSTPPRYLHNWVDRSNCCRPFPLRPRSTARGSFSERFPVWEVRSNCRFSMATQTNIISCRGRRGGLNLCMRFESLGTSAAATLCCPRRTRMVGRTWTSGMSPKRTRCYGTGWCAAQGPRRMRPPPS